MCLVTTICNNYEGYNQREIEEAKMARRAVAMIGHLTEQKFMGMVRNKMIKNCPVSPVAIANAYKIFGPDLAGVRGKTTRTATERAEMEYVAIPRDLLNLHKNVVVSADVMFVNGMPFLVTVTRAIKLITIKYLERRTAKQLSLCLNRIIQLYLKGGFHVKTFYMDGEFEKIKTHMPQVDINTTRANEHVGKVERAIRTLKEHARSIINTLPFSALPKHILIKMMYHVALWLNAFPAHNGISSKFSPREIVTHVGLDFKKHCRVPFVTYCEVHEYPNPLNSMAPRTKPAIALGPTGNAQGTHKFFCLTNGTLLRQNDWTEYPMPDNVIRTVNSWGRKSMQPDDEFEFANRNREPFPWNSAVDEQMHLTNLEPVSFPTMAAEMPGLEMDNSPTPALEDKQDTYDSEPTPEEQQHQAAQAAANTDLDHLPPPIPAQPNEIEPTVHDEADDVIAVDAIPQEPMPQTPIEIEDDNHVGHHEDQAEVEDDQATNDQLGINDDDTTASSHEEED